MADEKMGFGSNDNPSTWITINNGKLTVRAEEDAEGAVRREYTNKAGEVKHVWEYQFPNFTGEIVGSNFEETKWGMMFNVLLSAGEKEYALRMQAPGRLFDQFAKRIPNINKDIPLYVGAFVNERGHNVLYLKQDGQKVPMAFSKDVPNGLPPAVQGTKMGKTTWDFSDQEEFLYNLATGFHGEGMVPEAAPAAVEEESPF